MYIITHKLTCSGESDWWLSSIKCLRRLGVGAGNQKLMIIDFTFVDVKLKADWLLISDGGGGGGGGGREAGFLAVGRRMSVLERAERNRRENSLALSSSVMT